MPAIRSISASRLAVAAATAVVAGTLAVGSLSGVAWADDAPASGPAPATLGFATTTTTAAPGGSSGSGGSGTPTTVAAPTGGATADHMALGRAAIDKSDWTTAITEFTAAVAATPKNADAYNLLAYSYRKSGNLTKAFENYAVALKLDPKHRGALEYQGEAYVESGQITKAKANLTKLGSICGKKCEQYVDLAAAIAKATKKK